MSNNPFTDPSELSGGSFFKPREHKQDLALLIEPKRVDEDQKNEYKGAVTYRDEVSCDITVFGTLESLEKGVPTAINKDTKVTHGMLASAAKKLIGGAMVATVELVETKKGEGFAFRNVEADVKAQVGDYFASRSAEVAKNEEDAPDFD